MESNFKMNFIGNSSKFLSKFQNFIANFIKFLKFLGNINDISASDGPLGAVLAYAVFIVFSKIKKRLKILLPRKVTSIRSESNLNQA